MGKNASPELISTYFEKGERRKKGDPKVVRKLMPTPTVVKLYCRQIEANERDKLAESFLDYNTPAHTLCCECSYKYLIRGGQKVQKFSGDNMSNIGKFVKWVQQISRKFPWLQNTGAYLILLMYLIRGSGRSKNLVGSMSQNLTIKENLRGSQKSSRQKFWKVWSQIKTG